MVSAPKAPDPYETASAQATFNQQTAATTQAMNMVDQLGPDGSITYDQIGTQEVIGADGKLIQVPKYSQTTSLSPEQQAIYTQTRAAKGNIAGLAADQSDFMRDYLAKPFEFNNSDAEQWAYDLASPRILAQQGQNEASLRTTLAGKGIKEGSAAWKAEMSRLTQGNSDQLNQLALQGRGQAFTESLATRNQPIQELSALMSGSQINQPTFGGTPQTAVGGVDYSGLVSDQYQAQLQSANAGMGGLFGLLGTLGGSAIKAGMFSSDRRLKTDIREVGKLENGLPVYLFRYKAGGPMQLGLMAQDVEIVKPEAVGEGGDGYLMVDYGLATEAA